MIVPKHGHPGPRIKTGDRGMVTTHRVIRRSHHQVLLNVTSVKKKEKRKRTGGEWDGRTGLPLSSRRVVNVCRLPSAHGSFSPRQHKQYLGIMYLAIILAVKSVILSSARARITMTGDSLVSRWSLPLCLPLAPGVTRVSRINVIWYHWCWRRVIQHAYFVLCFIVNLIKIIPHHTLEFDAAIAIEELSRHAQAWGGYARTRPEKKNTLLTTAACIVPLL